MKKTAAPLLFIMLAAAHPALAERNPADPLEGYNRAAFKFNDTADRYVMAPVARGYRKITPKPVRTGVSNFFNNLRDVVSFGSNVLRLDAKRASEDLVRVGINTTFGLGGLIDVAGAGGVPNNKNSLGDTFASWGWKNSSYFVVPLLGPSTVRDSLGNAVTTVYPVKSAVFKTPAGRWSTTGLNAVNTREGMLDLTDSLDAAAIDKYSYTRDLFMRVRSKQTGGNLPQSPDENIDIDELVESGGSAADSQTAAPATADTARPYDTGRPSDWVAVH
ncbi:MlaA family lipoprotein [Neisseria chenwenguii]|uniref:ABC transporter n=1 Tax=Neisseria chenwenguii TaxID=1853278 RepID=A0A220S2J4_9NEIS|nr:MlaA family lipoprotein [Neisseria chenwenguii]ASK27405.1 ABC transporter [Neisseria chenwenguii]ROV56923.1 VacJ family lipoprotein [Neisseria chenwenguii]